ncbi:MAG: hypothetical protein MI892_30870 [Desulfobacterales bacterium]|nr:hypothetical protein [Desulfobacterales bacterium]
MTDKEKSGLSTSGVSLMPSMESTMCDALPDETGHERPGYTLCHWVDEFLETPVGDVPRISTQLDRRDRISTAIVRCGINRYRYTVTPGLYAVGNPHKDSEVLVTANFKLTFDHLRKELDDIDAWILVLDTKGINVWCAAGKGTFGTSELVSRIQKVKLDQVVDHKRLILPQLGATGVSAKKVKSDSGFRVIYGPVKASDLPRFLKNKRKADPDMRKVSFTFLERLILTPVEIQIAVKPALITALILFVFSGFGPGIFSFGAAWERGIIALGALTAGIFSGAVVTPALLPFIPVREFALKGIITGSVTGLLLLAALPGNGTAQGIAPSMALFLFTTTISSFLAMNFTGTTPFTSPSGVEKEMKRYIPAQLLGILASSGFWIYGAF